MAKLPTPTQLLDRHFKREGWQGIPRTARERYFRMLTLRALRFYMESNLDAYTIAEDLYDGASDTEFYRSGYAPLKKTDLVNLIDSEQHEAKFYQDMK